jgi:hypothetical protein
MYQYRLQIKWNYKKKGDGDITLSLKDGTHLPDNCMVS